MVTVSNPIKAGCGSKPLTTMSPALIVNVKEGDFILVLKLPPVAKTVIGPEVAPFGTTKDKLFGLVTVGTAVVVVAPITCTPVAPKNDLPVTFTVSPTSAESGEKPEINGGGIKSKLDPVDAEPIPLVAKIDPVIKLSVLSMKKLLKLFVKKIVTPVLSPKNV